MRKIIIAAFVFLLLIGCAGNISVVDQLKDFDCWFNDDHIKRVYSDGFMMFLMRNHTKMDVTVFTWHIGTFKSMIMGGWPEVHLISKKDFLRLRKHFDAREIQLKERVKNENKQKTN